MGNTCGGTLANKSSFVISVTASSADELTFTDIDNAWQVANQDTRKSKLKNKATLEARKVWKTVRVFVSSTFRDFDAEREILVKKVFPDLREWCQSRRLHLVDIDLRWGVPKDSTTENTLRTCLGEIDRCFNENLQPFFVNMTSERIGWIPLGNQLPPALKKEYRWVDGLSVTEMEILHGAYRIDNPNALFMIRDSSFLETVPPELHHYFVDECGIASYKLDKLKKNIEDRFGKTSRVVAYKSEYSHVDPYTKMPRFKDLDASFASVVLTFFQERIAAQYPLIDDKKQDPFEEAKTQHESFMKMASERVVGRDVLINEFVDTYINKTTHLAPVVIFGGPGLGKTSIMAALSDRCRGMALKNQLPRSKTGDRWLVFSHFVGAIAGSTDQLGMLNRLLLETKTIREDDKKPTALDEALGLVRGALANHKTKNCIVIVDAVNQFDDFRGLPAPISWLPSRISSNVRIFISLTPESGQFKNVKEAGNGWTFLELQPLDRETKERMVTSHLARYNKQLDRGQLELLLNKCSSDNPMWLSLATEELRIFGRFRELTNKIGTLPDSLAELENEILARFERESDGSKLIAALCLLECSVRGLLESELLELLAAPDLLPPPLMSKLIKAKVEGHTENVTNDNEALKVEGQNRLTAAQWADVYRVLRPFMRPFGLSGEGRLDFYHRSLSKAVRNRYYLKAELDEDGNVTSIVRQDDIVEWFHKRLADYFSKTCKHLERRVEEFPTHAWKSKDVEGLTEFLCDWEIFDLMYDPEHARELSLGWEHVYYLKMGENVKDKAKVFQFLEENYVKNVNKIVENFNEKTTIQRMERVTRILMQNGCFEAAEEMSSRLVKLAFPEVDDYDSDVKGEVPFYRRHFKKSGEKLSNDNRLKFARLLYLKGLVSDEKSRQIDYVSRSVIDMLIVLLDSYERCIAIFEELSPNDPLLCDCLNRCSLNYAEIGRNGGSFGECFNREDCIRWAVEKIDKAIAIYKSKSDQNINLANCYITRSVSLGFGDPEQLTFLIKGLDLILETAGPLHPLLFRAYINTAIYYEETGQYAEAYSNFRKWYEVMLELYGRHHPRTQRAIRTLNEPIYLRKAKENGHTPPSIDGVEKDEDED